MADRSNGEATHPAALLLGMAATSVVGAVCKHPAFHKG
jgi:hypothetical protein